MALPALALGIGLPALTQRIFGRRNRRSSVDQAIKSFLQSNPQGELSPSDIAFGERQFGRANEVIGAGVQQGSQMATRRFRARGLTGGAEEQAHSDVQYGGSLARRDAARDVLDKLDEIREGNKNFERSKLFTAFGAQVGDIQRQQVLDEGQRSAWYNSMLELLPNLLDFGKARLPTTSLAYAANQPYEQPDRR